MDILRRYTRAVVSSNLKSDEYHMDTDTLAAAALASRIGVLLYRVKYVRDAHAYRPLLVMWRKAVRRMAAQRHWREQWNPTRIAKLSLDYWIGDQCDPCNGTGFPMLEGIPTRSPKMCQHCEGTGVKKVECPRQLREPTLDMYQELLSMADKFEANTVTKLRGARR